MTRTSSATISVLIVSWNTRDILRSCLGALAQESLPLQVIVVDNGSVDGSPEMVRSEFPQFTLAAVKENLGFVGGNNRAYGLIDPGARYVLLLNPDAVLEPNALQRMTDFLDHHPKAGACGPVLLNSDRTLQPSWSRFPAVAGEIFGSRDRGIESIAPAGMATIENVRLQAESGVDRAPRVDWVGGACILLRRAAIDNELGGVLFDTDFQMYSEETDLCYRLFRAGFSTHLILRAEVIHHSGLSSSQAPIRTIQLLYRSKYLFFRKHHGPLAAFAFRAAVTAVCAAKGVFWALLAVMPTAAQPRAAARRDSQYAVASSFLRGIG